MAKIKGLSTIICGPRDCVDYAILLDAISESGFKISEVVSGGAKGVDFLGEKWAKENNIPIKRFPADWKNLKAEGAVIKEGDWGKYNANAGFARNEEMANYAKACIAINIGNTPGTADMIKRAKVHNLEIFIYKPEKKDEDYEYSF